MDKMVMVVEDDASTRELVIAVLAIEGFTPVAARDGAEALRQLREEQVHPELILLDLMMPVMDGWQFRAEQLKDPALAAIPVVVMSAAGDVDVPAEGHVDKPFDLDVLVDVVSRCVRSCPVLH